MNPQALIMGTTPSNLVPKIAHVEQDCHVILLLSLGHTILQGGEADGSFFVPCCL